MGAGSFGWHCTTFLFGKVLFLETKNIQKVEFYSSKLKKLPRERFKVSLGFFLRWKYKKIEENLGAEPYKALVHCPPPHLSVLRVVVGPDTLSLGRMLRRWAVRIIVGPYASSLGLTRCRQILILFFSPLLLLLISPLRLLLWLPVLFQLVSPLPPIILVISPIIQVVIVQSPLLSGIRRWSSLVFAMGIHHCWGGFAGVGHHWVGFAGIGCHWVGCIWICHGWVGFVVVGVDLSWLGMIHLDSSSLDSTALVVVGLVLPVLVLLTLALRRRCWSSLG